jgi:DNA-binding helix-hairpin-helix protein with protein kinase domain
LAAHGIFSAADIEAQRILAIKGFKEGLTSNLIVWKQQVLQQFRFDAVNGIPPADQRSLAVQFRGRQQQVLAELAQELGRLESLTPECRAAREKRVPDIRRAIGIWRQAEADLHVLRARP